MQVLVSVEFIGIEFQEDSNHEIPLTLSFMCVFPRDVVQYWGTLRRIDEGRVGVISSYTAFKFEEELSHGPDGTPKQPI